MAISENLETDIDITIAMWCQQRRIVDISWNDRCALRKLIYDLFIAESLHTDTVETTNNDNATDDIQLCLEI